MNIFKVLASGKKSFQEETASAIIAWFMNPKMEHGLGYLFLTKVIERIDNNREDIRTLLDGLRLRLRSSGGEEPTVSCYLEYSVEGAFIDIVFEIDANKERWTISIENKIYPQSAQDKFQLKKQYTGLRSKYLKDECNKDRKIAMIFLVPLENETEDLFPQIQDEFNGLGDLQDSDIKGIFSWQQSNKYSSIASIIAEILEDESKGIIEPISEYTRHTLKAFSRFIADDFTGYLYENKKNESGLNPMTENRFSIAELENKQGFVGVQYGISGLLQLESNQILKTKFQYTSEDMSGRRNWIRIADFNRIIEWMNSKSKGLEWLRLVGKLPVEALYKIAKRSGDEVYIGIKGGEKSLQEMPPQIIKTKNWGISTKQPSEQWIKGRKFAEIIETQGIIK